MILRRYNDGGYDSMVDNFNNVPTVANDPRQETLLFNIFADSWFVCVDQDYYRGNYAILRPQ